LIGLTSLLSKNPPMEPKLNRKRAQFVLAKIDQILDWERRVTTTAMFTSWNWAAICAKYGRGNTGAWRA